MITTFTGADGYGLRQRLRTVLADRLATTYDRESPAAVVAASLGQSSLFASAQPLVVETGGSTVAWRNDLAAMFYDRLTLTSEDEVYVLAPEQVASEALGKLLAQGTIETFAPLSQGALIAWLIDQAKQVAVTLPKPLAVAMTDWSNGNRFALASEVAAWQGLEQLDSMAIEGSLRLAGGAEVSPFALGDAWGSRQQRQALEALAQASHQGVSVQAMLGQLERQARLLWLCAAQRATGVGEPILPGVSPYVVKKTGAQAKRWQADELAGALSWLRDIDRECKQRAVPEAPLLELFIVGTI